MATVNRVYTYTEQVGDSMVKLSTDAAHVTLGIDSGLPSTFERYPATVADVSLSYHFLFDADAPEVDVVSRSFLPAYGAPYVYNDVTYHGWAARSWKIGHKGKIGIPGLAHYRVDIPYTLMIPNLPSGELPENAPEPSVNDDWSEPPRYGSRIEKVPAAKDLDGNPIVNSAGLPFDPSMTFDNEIDVWTFKRREYRNPLSRMKAFKRCVNSEEFWGFRPWEVYVENIDPREVRVAGTRARYWEVTYTLAINTFQYAPNIYGWMNAALDAGTLEIDPDSPGQSEWRRVTKKGEPTPVSYPVPLKSGRAIDTSVSGWQNQLTYLVFRMKNRLDLNDLHLPNPFK